MPVILYVLDTSAIIAFKHQSLIPIERLWWFLRCLEGEVERGRVFFPHMVVRELTDRARVPHPDAPGTWAIGVAPLVADAHHPDVASALRVASDVVDVEDPIDADPYVLAQALELREQAPDAEACVVSEDVIGRSSRLSISMACARFDPPLRHMRAAEFIAASGCLPAGAAP